MSLVEDFLSLSYLRLEFLVSHSTTSPSVITQHPVINGQLLSLDICILIELELVLA